MRLPTQKNDTRNLRSPDSPNHTRMTEKPTLLLTAQEIFEEAFTLILGPSICEVIASSLQKRFGKDPYEVLFEEPAVFYTECAQILTGGTDVLLRCVGECIAEKYKVSCSPEEFVKLLHSGDESSKAKMHKILAEINEKSGPDVGAAVFTEARNSGPQVNTTGGNYSVVRISIPNGISLVKHQRGRLGGTVRS